MSIRRAATAKVAAGGAIVGANLANSKNTANPWNSVARACDDESLARWKQQAERGIALAYEGADDEVTALNTIDLFALLLEAIESEQGKRRRVGFTMQSIDRGFSRELLDEIRQEADIVRLFQEHVGVDLRRIGKTYRARCPWHDGASDTSLTVWPDIGGWRCWGCQSTGDAFTTWQLVYGCDFPTAVREVARFAGVTLSEKSPHPSRTNNRVKVRVA